MAIGQHLHLYEMGRLWRNAFSTGEWKPAQSASDCRWLGEASTGEQCKTEYRHADYWEEGTMSWTTTCPHLSTACTVCVWFGDIMVHADCCELR